MTGQTDPRSTPDAALDALLASVRRETIEECVAAVQDIVDFWRTSMDPDMSLEDKVVIRAGGIGARDSLAALTRLAKAGPP